MDYSKYYNLEKYLFDEVKNNFNKRGYLLVEEFFCIIIWKANRAKSKIKKKLLGYGKLYWVIRTLTNQIFITSEPKDKMRILIHDYKFGLPMASAILSVLYPYDFTVYDYRVIEQLKMKPIYSIDKYFLEFLPKVRKFPVGRSLREKDKYLWGKSSYEDLMKFLK